MSLFPQKEQDSSMVGEQKKEVCVWIKRHTGSYRLPSLAKDNGSL